MLLFLLAVLWSGCTNQLPQQLCSCNVSEPACSSEEMLITVLEHHDTCINTCDVPKCVSIKTYYHWNASAHMPPIPPTGPLVICTNDTPQKDQVCFGADNCTKIPPNKNWECHGNRDIVRDNQTQELQALKILKSYGATCTQQGGINQCGGYCRSYYPHYCDFPYTDAGQGCTSSDQCQGSCETTYEHSNCTENCSGNCTQYPIRGSFWMYEVVNDTSVVVMGINID
jgi:hypothetical protein